MDDPPDEPPQEIPALGVPYIRQDDDYSCVPRSIKMVLEYINNTHPSTSNPTVDEICDSIKTTRDGTIFTDIDRINKLLSKSIPSIEFVRDSGYPTWESVLTDLRDKKPVILWILSSDRLGREFHHSVVVEGYVNDKVLYKDSIHGYIEEDLGTFLAKWDAMLRFTVRVKVGQRIERKITEYTEEDRI